MMTQKADCYSEVKTSKKGSQLPLPPCKVCAGTASGLHFGVNTCEACKAFFRRYLLHKENYKCSKEGKCLIEDRKRGNCPHCRINKCITLGMSKDAVRHGRYTIAIRTRTIMEVKKLNGEMAVESTSPKSALIPDSTHCKSLNAITCDSSYITRDECPDSTQCDMSPVATRKQKVPPVRKPRKSRKRKNVQEAKANEVSERNLGRERQSDESCRQVALVDPCISAEEIQTMSSALVAAHENIYPFIRTYLDDNFMTRKQKEVYEQYKLKLEMFGSMTAVTKQAYDECYRTTGLDLDNRKSLMEKHASHMERAIVRFVNFVKAIPGFVSLPAEDQITLIKASRYEFWLLGHYQKMNKELKVQAGGEMNLHQSDLEGISDKAFLEAQYEFADSLKKMTFTFEELAVLRAVVVTFTDRCQLRAREKVEEIHWKLVNCLKYMVESVHPHDKNRLARIFGRLTGMRELTEWNRKQNKHILADTALSTVIQKHPLILEIWSD